MNNKATFNERFAMKTILDYDVFNDEYDPKPVSKNKVLDTYYIAKIFWMDCWSYL